MRRDALDPAADIATYAGDAEVVILGCHALVTSLGPVKGRDHPYGHPVPPNLSQGGLQANASEYMTICLNSCTHDLNNNYQSSYQFSN